MFDRRKPRLRTAMRHRSYPQAYRIDQIGPPHLTAFWQIDRQASQSIQVLACIFLQTQDEVDTLWTQLTSGGGEPGRCGWLKDRYGLSWQIIPTALSRLLGDPDWGRASRAMRAMLEMNKIDIATLERAAAG